MGQRPNGENKSMEGCVMLALSTFRRSEKAVSVAIEKCQEIKRLMIVYVVDINVARYIIGAEEEFFIGLKEQCEAEMLEKAEKEAREHVATIDGQAEKSGMQVKTFTSRPVCRCLPRCGEAVTACPDCNDSITKTRMGQKIFRRTGGRADRQGRMPCRRNLNSQFSSRYRIFRTGRFAENSKTFISAFV